MIPCPANKALSSLAVVVSNYEALAPYEESYGMDHNIINELSTFFIPRIIWKDKPVSIEPRDYGMDPAVAHELMERGWLQP